METKTLHRVTTQKRNKKLEYRFDGENLLLNEIKIEPAGWYHDHEIPEVQDEIDGKVVHDPELTTLELYVKLTTYVDVVNPVVIKDLLKNKELIPPAWKRDNEREIVLTGPPKNGFFHGIKHVKNSKIDLWAPVRVHEEDEVTDSINFLVFHSDFEV